MCIRDSFSDDPKAAAGLDMVLGTQGWRRFDWTPVFAPPQPEVTATPAAGWNEGMDMEDRLAEEPMPAPPPQMAPPPAGPRPMDARAPMKKPPVGAMPRPV